jgi:Mg-chelatase subunit ChlD
MGIIDTIRSELTSSGEPKADINPSSYQDVENDGSGGNEEGEGNGERGEQEVESGEEDNEKGEDKQGGGNPQDGDSESDNISEEELEDLKEDMENSSANRDMSDWTGSEKVGADNSSFVDQYFDQLQEERAEPETEMGNRKKDRDERIDGVRVHSDAEFVRDKYDSRFADEISEAFRKIKTREAPSPAEYGQRVNTRGWVRRKAGDPTEERLYLEMEPSEAGDRCVTVVVDTSGSMDELEIKLALMALADATKQIGDRFAATSYDTKTTRIGQTDYNVRTNLITAPTEEFKDEHLNSFVDGGYTPTAGGIKDGRAISDVTPNSEDVIIVITDGVANVDRDGTRYDNNNYDNPAMKEANQQVNTAINEGKRVIGLGVGEYLSDDAMQKIFGNNYFRADMDEISETLVEIYRQQMETA